MNRVILVIAIALSIGACTHLPPLPQPAAPIPAGRLDVAPTERAANFNVLLSAPLSELEALLREQLTLPSAPDWQLVTAPKESPEVEVRYEAELLPPEISLQGPTLTLKLRVAYFGALRARVHTPFGWIRLTKNTRWGDAERRGLIEVTVQSALEIGADYQLRTRSTLQDVALTAPPIDQLCAGGAFKVCIPADTVARPLHAELERRIRARVDEGLVHVDERVSERASIAGLAQRMWEKLFSAPLALPSGERLHLRPLALTLSYPFVAGDQLAVVLGIRAAPIFHDHPPSSAPPLPALSVAEPGATLVPLIWLEPLSAISAGLSNAARIGPSDDGQAPTKIDLLGTAVSEGRFLVALGFTREGQERTAYGEAAITCEGDKLKLDALTLAADSEQLLALAEVDKAAFLKAASAASYRPSAALDPRVRSLRALIADALAPLPIDPLANTQARLISARAALGGVWLEAELY